MRLSLSKECILCLIMAFAGGLQSGCKPQPKTIHLRTLQKGQTREITDEDICTIVPVGSTTVFNAGRFAIGDLALKHLGECKSLRELTLDGTEITDEGLQHLQGLKKLEYLSLINDNITDKGIRYLEKCELLRTLNISGTYVSKEGVDWLRNKFPGMEIQWSEAGSEDARKAIVELQRMGIITKSLYWNVRSKECPKERPNFFYLIIFHDNMHYNRAKVNELLKTIAIAENIWIDIESQRNGTLTILRNLQKVDELCLSGKTDAHRVRMSDVDLQSLKSIKSLRKLRIRDNGISDKELGVIAEIHSLESLQISSLCNVSDRGLEQLSVLPNLEEIILLPASGGLDEPIQFTDNTLKSLSKLTHIRKLKLQSGLITDKGLDFISNMTSLESLDIRASKISNIGLESLAKLPNLKELIMRCPQINEEALPYLDKLKNLQKLNMQGTSIPADAIQRFLSANPHVEISDL